MSQPETNPEVINKQIGKLFGLLLHTASKFAENSKCDTQVLIIATTLIAEAIRKVAREQYPETAHKDLDGLILACQTAINTGIPTVVSRGPKGILAMQIAPSSKEVH